jgi:hypothetical protein
MLFSSILKINSYSLYKYFNLGDFNAKKIESNIDYLFVYPHNLHEFYSLKFEYNENLNRLILSLKNKKIDYIFLIYDSKNIIHSSGVCSSSKPDDKFFYNFQEKKYAVILSTHTHKQYRGKQYYKKALQLQIKNIIEKLNISDIFISTLKVEKKLSPFDSNNFKKFCSGQLFSLFNKIHIYIIFDNFIRIRIFFNDNLIIKFK